VNNSDPAPVYSQVRERKLTLCFRYCNSGGAALQSQKLKEEPMLDDTAVLPIDKGLSVRGKHARNSHYFCGETADKACLSRVGGQNVWPEAAEVRDQPEQALHVPGRMKRFL
jgi:hypothetical protein